MRKRKNGKKTIPGSGWLVVCYLMTGILAVSAVRAAVFLMKVPDSLTVILCVLLVLSGSLCFSLVCKSLKTRIPLILFGIFAAAFSILGNYCNPYWNSISFRKAAAAETLFADRRLRTEEAEEDLEYMMRYLKKLHPEFYGGTPPEVQARYEEARTELKKRESVSVWELARMAESVISVLRDSHSQVRWPGETTHYLRDMYRFTDLWAVNGIELTDLMEQTTELYSYEMDRWHLRRLKLDCLSLEGLRYLGFCPENGITYTTEGAEGKRTETVRHIEDFLSDRSSAAAETESESGRKAENRTDTGTERKEAAPAAFVSYEILKPNDTAVLTLNSCRNNEEYKNCLREMFEEVKELGIGNVAVDLRNNTGGNSDVITEFIRYLDTDTYRTPEVHWRLGWFMKTAESRLRENDRYQDLGFQGKVYVLTSSSTFSSALLFAEYIQDNNLGILVGEAPGASPESYGDTAGFSLPNSGLILTVSTKKFFRVDRNRPGDILEPDIPCDSTGAEEMLYGVIRLDSWLEGKENPAQTR